VTLTAGAHSFVAHAVDLAGNIADTAATLINCNLGSRIVGGNGNDLLVGGDGNDKLVGGAGNDTMDGGAGADTMVGGLGDDTYMVDNVGDLVRESGVGYDVVMASLSFTLSANVEELDLLGGADLAGIGNRDANLLRGNVGANMLNGAAGNDTLLGGDGNDTLDGGSGADSMAGGTGNDLYLVDNIGDLVVEGFGEGIDTVMSSISFTLGDNVENLTLTKTAAINGTGNALANLIIGNTAANVLNGGAGNDTLMGGLGKDILTGGDGADVFRYGSIGEGGDRIMDFVHGVDALELDAAGFGGGLMAGMDLAVAHRFVAGKSADQAYGQFIFTAASSTLFWDADGIGAGAKVALVSFTAGTALTASDLHLI
jgi:Ca2+-binding RTX toxin-like protein